MVDLEDAEAATVDDDDVSFGPTSGMFWLTAKSNSAPVIKKH